MTRPNVVLIHTDQLRYDCVGCDDNPAAVTPNIDALARDGTVCTRHIAANTACMPSRASLLTGLYPPAHNVWCNGVALPRAEYAVYRPHRGVAHMQPEPPTLADVFADAGYDTASFGKLHLTPNLAPVEAGYQETWAAWADGRLDDWHGPYYGFRYVDMTEGHGEQPCRGGHYGAWLQREHAEVYDAVQDRAARERPVDGLDDLYASPVPHELHNSNWLAGRFASYLTSERPMDRPFFAFVGFPDPHHPFTPSYDVLEEFAAHPVPEPHDSTGEAWAADRPWLAGMTTDISHLGADAWQAIRRYTYAQVNQVDRAVGRILAALDDAGLADNTIVAFTSDHGDFLGDHGLLRKGYAACDALLHVPFILRAPGAGLPARVDAPMSNCDVMPTLAGLAGIDLPAYQDGRDLREILAADDGHQAFAFCAKDARDVRNYTVYDDRFRLTWYPDRDVVELIDHRSDPGENVNIAADHPDVVAELRTRILERLARSYCPILKRESAW